MTRCRRAHHIAHSALLATYNMCFPLFLKTFCSPGCCADLDIKPIGRNQSPLKGCSLFYLAEADFLASNLGGTPFYCGSNWRPERFAGNNSEPFTHWIPSVLSIDQIARRLHSIPSPDRWTGYLQISQTALSHSDDPAAWVSQFHLRITWKILFFSWKLS